MARRKTVVIDGKHMQIEESAKLSDLVPVDAASIVTNDGKLITRAEMAGATSPSDFAINLSGINKG